MDKPTCEFLGRFLILVKMGTRQPHSMVLAHVVQQGAELQPQVIQRAETDTKGQCSKLKDIADDLNTYVNNSIKSVLSSSSEPFDSAEIVNKTFYSLARPQMVFLCPVEIWANNQPNKSGGGY